MLHCSRGAYCNHCILYFATSFAAKIIMKIILLFLLLAPSVGSLNTWVESSIFAVSKNKVKSRKFVKTRKSYCVDLSQFFMGEERLFTHFEVTWYFVNFNMKKATKNEPGILTVKSRYNNFK